MTYSVSTDSKNRQHNLFVITKYKTIWYLYLLSECFCKMYDVGCLLYIKLPDFYCVEFLNGIVEENVLMYLEHLCLMVYHQF